ncbi:MAG: hypothetical protein RIR18_2116 [Pseudomonadota bacterium]|jgi:histidinol-phosphate aminotransferase
MTIANQSLPYIGSIAPYQPGKPITELARETGIAAENIVKLASNENPLGMSSLAQVAVEKAIAGIARYPDQFELVSKIANRLKVEEAQIVLGNGSNDVLDLIASVFLAPGRSSVFSAHAFAVYPLATLAAGGTNIVAPALNYGHDLSAMLMAIQPETRIVWIANPNNPTGTFLPASEIKAFLVAVPDNVIVVLDEAYNEYLPLELRKDSVAWIKEFPNLVITRTFSKIYGLAGLRVGYAVASEEVAGLLNRIRQPFNVNNLALAGALAALDDHEFIQRSFELNQQGLTQIQAGLDALNLEYLPAFGNFVTFKVGVVAAAGNRVNQILLNQGVIVRPIGAYGMPEWLRVTVGTELENARFLTALQAAF